MEQRPAHLYRVNKLLLLILLIALGIRMAFFISLRPWDPDVVSNTVVISDARHYHLLALSLLENRSFEGFNGFRTPGYPVFIALLYSISSGSVWFVLLAQVLLSASTVYLVFASASLMFTNRVATLAAFLFAIDIHQALYAVTLYSDTLYVFLFILSIYFFIRGLKEKRLTILGLGALFLGIATLERPVSILFPVVAAVFMVALCHLTLRTRMRYALIYGLIFMVVLSPWVYHNHHRNGAARLTSQSDSNLLFWNVAATEAYKTGKPIAQVKGELLEMAIRQGADTSDLTAFRNSSVYRGITGEYIRDHFKLYVKRHLMGMVNMYAGLATKHITSIFRMPSKPLNVGQDYGPNIFARMADFFRSKSTGELFIAAIAGLYLLGNYLFALFAVILLIRKRNPWVFLLVMIILYFSFITGVIGNTRFRLPFMPFIQMLCAVGLLHLFDRAHGSATSGPDTPELRDQPLGSPTI